MKEKNLKTKKLKDAEGKRLLQKTILEYSKEIINILLEEPELLSFILNKLEITEDFFYESISGSKKTDIGFYDQTLICLKKVKKNNNSTTNKI